MYFKARRQLPRTRLFQRFSARRSLRCACSAGPRNCIGNHFAMLEAVIALACLLRAVRLRTEPAKIKLATGITLRPAQPVLAEVSVA